jgi:hypothetical protein
MGKSKPTDAPTETDSDPGLPTDGEIGELAWDLLELADHMDAAGVDVYATGRMNGLMREQINPLRSDIRHAGPTAPVPRAPGRIDLKTGKVVEPPADTMLLESTQRIDELPIERQKLFGLFGAIQMTIGRALTGKCTGPEAAADLRKQAAQLQRCAGAGAGDDRPENEERWQTRAIAAMLEHRDWNGQQIAKYAGVSRQTLYDDPDVGPALKARNKQKRTPDRRSSAPHGERDPETGQIDCQNHRQW